MRIPTILSILICGFLVTGCDYESYEEELALGDLITGEKFVRFSTGGASGMSEFVISEDGDSTTNVVIQNLFPGGGDVTVDYAIGGTAEYGSIYSIEGATETGGTLVVPFQNADSTSTAPAEASFMIEFLVDTLLTAPQTIVLDLQSATSSDNTPFDVGQGSLRTTLTITLVND
ncbi:MAG: hypothetical protein WA952_19920 [Lewinella sp.]